MDWVCGSYPVDADVGLPLLKPHPNPSTCMDLLYIDIERGSAVQFPLDASLLTRSLLSSLLGISFYGVD